MSLLTKRKIVAAPRIVMPRGRKCGVSPYLLHDGKGDAILLVLSFCSQKVLEIT